MLFFYYKVGKKESSPYVCTLSFVEFFIFTCVFVYAIIKQAPERRCQHAMDINTRRCLYRSIYCTRKRTSPEVKRKEPVDKTGSFYYPFFVNMQLLINKLYTIYTQLSIYRSIICILFYYHFKYLYIFCGIPAKIYILFIDNDSTF